MGSELRRTGKAARQAFSGSPVSALAGDKGRAMVGTGNRSLASLKQLWSGENGQDIAEYSIMLAVILVIVVGTVRLIGSNANHVFSEVSSAIQ